MTEVLFDAAEFDGADSGLIGPEVVVHSHDRRRLEVAGTATTALVGTVLALWGGSRVVAGASDGWAATTAMPSAYWIAVGLSIVMTGMVIWTDEVDGRSLLTWLLPVWIAVAHLAPSLGGRGLISTDSATLLERSRELGISGTDLDVVVESTGFLGLMSVTVANMASGAWSEWLLRLWPIFIAAVTAVLIASLARRSFPRTPKAGPLAAVVYIVISTWGAQGLMPSSTALPLLVAILVLIETGPLQAESRSIARIPVLARQAESIGDRPDSSSIEVFVSLTLVIFGAIAIDSFMPAAVCSALMVLAAFGRRVAWRLWFLATIAFTLWSVAVGRAWWSGGFSRVSDDLDRFATTLAGDSSPMWSGQQVAAWVAITLVAFVLICSLLMASDRFVGLRPTVPLVPVAMAMVVALLVTYSTEGLETQLLGLISPFAAVLAGRLLAALQRTSAVLVVPLMLAILVPLMLVVRLDTDWEPQAAASGNTSAAQQWQAA